MLASKQASIDDGMFFDACLTSVCISLSCTTTKQTHPMDFTMYQFALIEDMKTPDGSVAVSAMAFLDSACDLKLVNVFF
jgi:hypothetical protein